MLNLERRLISYKSAETGENLSHYILIALQGNKNILLSHENLFLSARTKSSKDTSSRYSNIISMFYRYLSTQDRYKDLSLAHYHVITTNKDIRRWQVARQIDRLKNNSERPSSQTIFEDAKILLTLFDWLSTKGYVTNVEIEMKTWVANFKSNKMLNYIERKAGTNINPENIRVLDKQRRQAKTNQLIKKDEITTLIESYSDPVYAALFKLSLGTAMRPMDLCKFPYIGVRKNKHIMPANDMNTDCKTIPYTVYGSKGNKDREIRINLNDLKALEKHYTKPYYKKRCELFEKKHGRPCPPSVLFLNKKGEPVTKKMISQATLYAKKVGMKKHPEFRKELNFYQARHWWPTQFIIRFFGDKLLTDAADALVLACAEVLKMQMGHENIETTYKRYIDMARVAVMTNGGEAHELVTDESMSVEDFIDSMEA